jgi:hypothetical protein
MKLFAATSKMTKKGYGKLSVHWFVTGRESWQDTNDAGRSKKLPRDASSIVPQWDSLDERNKHGHQVFVQECFSEDEIKQLRKYLKRTNFTGDLIVEDAYPAPDNIMGYSAIGIGGGDREVHLCEDDRYDLPFSVVGHYFLYENGISVPDEDIEARTMYEEAVIARLAGDIHGIPMIHVPHSGAADGRSSATIHINPDGTFVLVHAYTDAETGELRHHESKGRIHVELDDSSFFRPRQ